MSKAASYNELTGNANGRRIPYEDEGGSGNPEAKASPTSSVSVHHSHHPSRDVGRKTPVAGMYGAGTARAAAEKLAAQQDGKPRNQEAVNGDKDDGGRQDIPLETDTMLEIVQKKTLLHGTLDVWIKEASHLPDMNVVSQKFKQLFAIVFVCGNPFAKAKAKVKDNTQGHGPKGITSDPYAAVILAGARVARTRVIKNDKNPKWNEQFSIPVAHYVKDVQITIKTDDMIGAPIVGDVSIPVEEVIDGQILDGWYPIVNNSRKHPLDCQLHLRMVFHPAEKNALYQQGVEGENLYAVPNAYFPCRRGGNITLYQDAHIMDGSLPEIVLENGEKYYHRQAWEDLCTAILDAHHMVYITGWSIFTKVKLLRDTTRDFPEGGDLMLGDLLKRKSAEGVRVLVLAWDDKTSHSSPFLKTEGMMGVHDETTKNFFRNSSVRCVLAPRYASHKLSWFRQQVVGTLYTHHQKLTIVDAQGPGNKRTLISFIGGLDLCDGRWDTPSHSLFSTLETLHKDDFHSPTFSVMAEGGGPRQPWHDWHCKIEGPAVYDTLTNFEQRWRKATRWHDDELVQIGRISWILSPKPPFRSEGDPTLFVTNDDAPNSWHVQVLRSIDSGSAKGFPKNVQDAQKQHLVWGKGVAIDISIQMAYIKAIRCAQHFIYIENQYFIGSSYNWPDYINAGANHLIPMELALKVASKIRQGQRFAVYIVLPMWPEGAPDSASMQEILYFQAQTIKMMYGVVAQALRDVGKLNIEHPCDYLNFYCLGNRETETQTEKENPAPNPSDEASKHGQAKKHRRFMVYVHAKGIVVDDEYVICGSANINQRSMDGSRDTEIAMGGYQPHYTWTRQKKHPLGQIYGFRMSLWSEHLGVVDPIFQDPASLECVLKVNKMAKDNWEQYLAEEVTDMKGHLMPYPFVVNHDGTIGSIPGHETFPDVGGSVLGTNQPNIPDSLTT